MTAEVVYCESCDHARQDGPSYAWLCEKVPRYGTGFVTTTLWDKDPPYERCVRVNRHGNCRWWKAIPCAPSES